MSETCSSWGESCQTLINALLIWRNGGTERVRIHTSTSDTTQVAGQWCAAEVWLSPAALLDAEWGHREQTEVTGNMHCPIDGTRPGPGCVCLRLFESFPIALFSSAKDVCVQDESWHWVNALDSWKPRSCHPWFAHGEILPTDWHLVNRAQAPCPPFDLGLAAGEGGENPATPLLQDVNCHQFIHQCELLLEVACCVCPRHAAPPPQFCLPRIRCNTTMLDSRKSTTELRHGYHCF